MPESMSSLEIQEPNSPPPPVEHPPPVRILLLAFMAMFQGYAVHVGGPAHSLKHQVLGHHPTVQMKKDFQNATVMFQITKSFMRLINITLAPVMPLKLICYLSYVTMAVAATIPLVFVFWGGNTGEAGLFWVKLQYGLGGIAIGMFEGTFLSVISSLGKETKTFVIMGAPLGFFTYNTILGTMKAITGYPAEFNYVFCICCLPVAAYIFYSNSPTEVAKKTGGCEVIMKSVREWKEWIPVMIPWFVVKFMGNFVLEDGFPLFYNIYGGKWVPVFGGPSSTDWLISFEYFTALYWFVLMCLGDTVSRRVPAYIELKDWKVNGIMITLSGFFCVFGLSLYWFKQAIVAGLAVLISNFGNGFIYGLSAKFIDAYVGPDHRFFAYNLWCFFGDLGGVAGQSEISVAIADSVCGGEHYPCVCIAKDPCAEGFVKCPKDPDPICSSSSATTPATLIADAIMLARL